MADTYPLVTIVIPSYNHSKYVEESIISVVNQDYKNIELIIIDDGSSDDSVEKIKKLEFMCKTRFVRFEFRKRINKGICATLNEALEWSRGKYFSPTASDDIMLRSKTSFLVEKLEESGHSAAFGRMIRIGDVNSNTNTLKSKIQHTFVDLIQHVNIPNAPVAMILSEALKSVGGYPENIEIEDWYMWLKLTENGGVMNTYPEELALYRRHDLNTSNNIWLMHSNRVSILKQYKKHYAYEVALKRCNMMFFRQMSHLPLSKTPNKAVKEYNRLIYKIESQLTSLFNKDKKLALYGNGVVAKVIKEKIGRPYIIFDKGSSSGSDFENIYMPDKMKEHHFDFLIMTAIGYEVEILSYIEENNLVDLSKVILLDFL